MKYISVKAIIPTLFFCILMIGVAGCVKKNTAPEDIEKSVVSSGSERTEKINSHIFASANLSADRSDYLLGPGDLLEIKVLEADKLNTTVRVSSRGEVSLPLLGEINLKGKSASEAETLIENAYKESYIKDPHVSIYVKEHYSQRVTLVGQVKNPGNYDYPSKQRLLDAIALAGGLSDKAGYTVQIRRLSDGDKVAGSQQTVLVDLDELINEGREELNIEINGGDIIFVSEAGSYYVDGAVRNPGQYYIKHVLSINQALLAAGGLAPYANRDKLILVRKTDTGRKEILIDMEKDFNKMEGMTIQEDDMLYVNASFWGKLIHGGGLSIGFMGTGVNFRDPER